MQETQLDKQQMQAMTRVPFLAEFPYPEYTFYYQLVQTVNMNTSQPVGEPYDVILFSHQDESHTMVNVMEKELWHLYELRNNVANVNVISKTVADAFIDGNVATMSKACRDAETWFKEIKGKNFTVSASTFTDILAGYAGKMNKIDMITKLSWLTDRLYKGKGILYISPDEKGVLLKYYRFQLIYYRMLIGIIIAAKISI